MSATLGSAYFDRLYAENQDPWDFATSAYEDAKYVATIASLGGRRFQRTLEVGCSIGVLSGRLAEISGTLVATDLAEQALAQARARNHHRTNVQFERSGFPAMAPGGTFDLIVLSEVLYYLADDDLILATETSIKALDPNGTVLLVHWLAKTDYPLTGDQATAGFIAQAGARLTTVQQARTSHYRLDLLQRPA